MGFLDRAFDVAASSTELFQREVLPRLDAGLDLAGQRFDRAVAAVAPGVALQRHRDREALARYEGAKPGRLRQVQTDNSSGDVHVSRDADTLRATARSLERNHDLARGALSVLVRNIVGADGVGVEFTPRRLDGTVDEQLAADLNGLWREWQKRPEVTWSRGWASTCRIACRSWLRDGEMFGQHLAGNIPALQHGTSVPYSVELLEADLVPMHFNQPRQGIKHGIERNAWRRKIAYHVYKGHPGEAYPTMSTLWPETKRVPAERIVHPFMADRISQTRGVSLFASVITRIMDIKDYEESERVAAKVAASMAAYIKKGDASSLPESALDKDPDERRHMKFQAGMIFDDLGPGEEIGTIDTKRPSDRVADWRNDQLRAFAAGTETGHSSVAHRYDGNYAAQRQELVEQNQAYRVLGDEFIGQFIQPIVERFVLTAAAAGNVRVPRNIDLAQLGDARFRIPPMPWVDPVKEGEGLKRMRAVGAKSTQGIARERGEDWRDVVRENLEVEEFEQAERERRGLATREQTTE